ncbi:thioesterase family protein [Saccharopolyspora gloriosae]|uniref:thioesterase family protein n=1 Tax=Saccharopolyspora gloriosae TaxID=455344 RepID=UPI001FB77596|nr:thioesterase family protein [Saccharopolyspora gloriosae]
MTGNTPRFDQMIALPAVLEGTVTPEFIDLNGHMNIRHYLEYGAVGADSICRAIGMDEDYRSRRRMGVFAAEHHLSYQRELREGEKFSVHVRFLERTDKALHAVSMLLDRSNERLACTLEIVMVHVAMDSRRATPLPADIAAGLDHEIARSVNLEWRAPLCGAMGLRR